MHAGWMVDHAEQDGVLFLIGMRWRALWRLAYRPWVALAFARMLRARPESGLQATRLSVRQAGPVVVQTWRSPADLRRWARAGDEAHAAPWRRFRDEVGRTADWGVWHDVRVPDGQQASRRRGAGSHITRCGLAATLTRAVRTDAAAPAWDRGAMTTYRKRRALDLLLDALSHPVRFR